MLGLSLPSPAAPQGLSRVLVQGGRNGKERRVLTWLLRLACGPRRCSERPLSTPVALVGCQRCPSHWGPLTQRSSPCVTPPPTPRTVPLLLYRGPQGHGDAWGKSVHFIRHFIILVHVLTHVLVSPVSGGLNGAHRPLTPSSGTQGETNKRHRRWPWKSPDTVHIPEWQQKAKEEQVGCVFCVRCPINRQVMRELGAWLTEKKLH